MREASLENANTASLFVMDLFSFKYIYILLAGLMHAARAAGRERERDYINDESSLMSVVG